MKAVFLLLISLLLAIPATASPARCGWVKNAYGNVYMHDADFSWVIAGPNATGAYYQAEGILKVLFEGEFFKGDKIQLEEDAELQCACMKVRAVRDSSFQGLKVVKVHKYDAIPLSRCFNDKKIPSFERMKSL